LKFNLFNKMNPYFSFQLLENDIELVAVKDINKEYVAGALAIAIAYINDKSYKNLTIKTNNNFNEFRLIRDVKVSRIKYIMMNTIRNKKYCLWIYDHLNHYTLYNFDTKSFLFGMLDFSDAIFIDVRNYMNSLPYDKEYNLYEIENLLMKPIPYVTITKYKYEKDKDDNEKSYLFFNADDQFE